MSLGRVVACRDGLARHEADKQSTNGAKLDPISHMTAAWFLTDDNDSVSAINAAINAINKHRIRYPSVV
jgi:hypothetical protein